MKNLKSKLLILLVSILSLTSLLFVGSQKAEKVYAANYSSIKQSQTDSTQVTLANWTSVSNASKTLIYNLFGTSVEETINYYTIEVIDNNVSITGSKTITQNSVKVDINTSPGFNSSCIVKAYSKFNICDNHNNTYPHFFLLNSDFICVYSYQIMYNQSFHIQFFL